MVQQICSWIQSKRIIAEESKERLTSAKSVVGYIVMHVRYTWTIMEKRAKKIANRQKKIFGRE